MRRPAALLVVPLLLLASACTGGGDDASPTASTTLTAGCDAVRAALPASVLDRPRDAAPAGTSAAAGPDGGAVIGSYGDPAIVVSCGLVDKGPTTDPCQSINDVDWTYPEDAAAGSDKPVDFTTYGRTPVIGVRVPAAVGAENASAALVDLAVAVSPLPTNGACVGDDDVPATP